MKNKILLIIAAFHLLIILATSISQSIHSYLEFYVYGENQGPENKTHVSKQQAKFDKLAIKAEKLFNRALHKKPVLIYSKYTGAETGYGFFAPNVLSSGVICFKYKNKFIVPHFKSYESGIRFTSMLGTLIGHLVNPHDLDPEVEKIKLKLPNRQYANFYELEDQYFEVLFKNVATKVYHDYGLNDTLNVKLRLYDFPTLPIFNTVKNCRGLYLTIKSNNIFIKSNI